MDLGTVSNNAITGATPGASFTDKIQDLVSAILGTATIVAGIVLLLMLVMGGIEYITSSGDEKQTASAKRRISNAVLGLVIVVSSMTVTTIILKMFGIDLKNLPW
jgi:cytochrome bd-type quinol oxidase subunit 2